MTNNKTYTSTLVLLLLLSFGNTHAQETKLTAFDGEFADVFGFSVAIDGNYAIAGAPLQGGFGTQNAGAAYVFQRAGATWVYMAKLTPPWGGNFGDQFGYSVDIAGNYAIVGAIHADHSGKAEAGVAYVFIRSGTQWYLVTTLYANDAYNHDLFGNSVGITSEGIAIVGAADDDDNGTSSGSAYIFEPHYGNWVQVAKLHASDAHSGDVFGTDVAIDGSYAVVGAPANVGVHYLQSGAAYVFVNSHYGWSQTARLTHNDADVFDHLGQSVDIEGSYVIAGAPFANDKTGTAYIFSRSGTTWSQAAKLAPSDGAPHDKFGTGVGITNGYAAVGSYLDDDLGSESGSVYVYEQSGLSWSEMAKHTASDGLTGDRLGYRVDIDGTDAIGGAHYHDSGPTDKGAAYIFGPAIPPLQPCENNMVLSGFIQDGSYFASDYIQATGTILSPNHVQLVGTNYVELMPDMQIMAGATVEISLAGCP